MTRSERIQKQIRAIRWLDVAALVLILTPLALQAWLIYRLGVNAPIQDDWIYLPFVRRVASGAEWISWLWRQHNENRYVIVSLVIALNTLLTGWNMVGQMALGLVPTALSLRGLWLLYRRAGNVSLWLFVPAAWLLIHWSQYHNYLFGLQIGFLCAVCGVIWTAYGLNRSTPRFFVFALACAIFSTISSASGLFVWWMGAAQLVGQRAQKRLVAIWVAVAAVVYALYFFGYNPARTSGSLSSTLREPVHAIQFGLTLIGAALGTNQVGLSLILGLALLLSLGALAVWMWRARQFPRAGEWGAVGLVMFALVVSAVITVGRGHNKLEDALTSRYISLTVLVVIGLYILVVSRIALFPTLRRWMPGVAAVLLFGLAATNVAAWQNALEWSRTYGRMNKFIVQTQDLSNRAVLKNLLGKKQLQSRLGDLEFMRAHGLSVFRDPVEWWLILPRANGKPLAPLTTATPLDQTFRCPVQTLYDVSVNLQVRPASGGETLTLELLDATTGRALATRSVDSRTLTENARVFLDLPQPLTACVDKPLRFELAAMNSDGADTVSAFRYPPMYDGTLAQGGKVIPNASLGIELNTHVFDIRDGQ